jgi:hypothetical protein
VFYLYISNKSVWEMDRYLKVLLIIAIWTVMANGQHS